MSSKDDLVRRALGEKAILDAATALNQDTRSALATSMKAGERQPCEIDGVDLGMVYMTKPTTSVRVVDLPAQSGPVDLGDVAQVGRVREPVGEHLARAGFDVGDVGGLCAEHVVQGEVEAAVAGEQRQDAGSHAGSFRWM